MEELPSGSGLMADNASILGDVLVYSAGTDVTGVMYKCHLCSYSGTSKFEYKSHMNSHFDHKCHYCDYASRTEGRLKAHIRNFHSEASDSPTSTTAPTSTSADASWNAIGSSLDDAHDDNSNDSNDPNHESFEDECGLGSAMLGKPRKFRCKQCEFMCMEQEQFWAHSREHIKPEKMLTCSHCSFVTEFKHHLEYHVRRHFNSKPFKCPKCNYSCVNKSMLNSHMKSHSNIYQYRCRDCAYATKYCHSLKLHLRKYNHEPAEVLNLDGTPNPYPIIDVYGSRRGPRPKRDKQGQIIPPSASSRPSRSRGSKSKSKAKPASDSSTSFQSDAESHSSLLVSPRAEGPSMNQLQSFIMSQLSPPVRNMGPTSNELALVSPRSQDRNNNNNKNNNTSPPHQLQHQHQPRDMIPMVRSESPEEGLLMTKLPNSEPTSALATTSLPFINNIGGQQLPVNLIQQLEQMRAQSRQVEGIAALQNLAQSVNEANRNLLLNIYSFYYILNSIQNNPNDR